MTGEQSIYSPLQQETILRTIGNVAEDFGYPAPILRALSLIGASFGGLYLQAIQDILMDGNSGTYLVAQPIEEAPGRLALLPQTGRFQRYPYFVLPYPRCVAEILFEDDGISASTNYQRLADSGLLYPEPRLPLITLAGSGNIWQY